MNGKYYKASGKVSPIGLLMFLFGGILAAWLFSFVYVYLITHIRFLYVNVFVTLAYGVALGLVLSLFARKGHFRSPLIIGICSVIIGVLANHFQWLAFYAFDHVKHFPDVPFCEPYLFVLQNPGEIGTLMERLFEEGSHHIRRSNTVLKATPLVAIWIVETAIISLLPMLFAVPQGRKPYSERLHKWADKETLPRKAALLSDIERARASFEQGDFSMLNPCDECENYMNVNIRSVPNDDDCNYLTLETVNLVVRNNKKQMKKKNLIEYLRITPEIETLLRKRFAIVKEDDEHIVEVVEESTPIVEEENK